METGVEIQPAAAGAEQRAEHLRRYRWSKGQSGNDAARPSLSPALSAEFSAPSPVEHLMLQEAAKLLVKAERANDPDIAVRALGAVRRLLAGLRHRRAEDAPSQPRPPLPWSPQREKLGMLAPAKEPQG